MNYYCDKFKTTNINNKDRRIITLSVLNLNFKEDSQGQSTRK